ncbi:MAG: four helix bundle protein [Gemmatimonadales bacterium]
MALRANPDRLLVHQVSCQVSKEVVEIARTFRGPGAHARGDQVVRAALSVTSNIAEACGRNTVQEFRQFLGYAKGSAFELRTQLKLSRHLDPPRGPAFGALENRVTLVIKLIGRLQQHPPPEC